MPLVFVLLVLVLLAVVAVVAAGRGGELAEPVVDRAPLGLPKEGPLDAAALERVRFSLGFRGYRMDQVDTLLDRVSGELADRDAHIAELQAALDAERRRRQPELAPTTRDA